MEMRNKLKINTLDYREQGTEIVYDFTYDKGVSKYFNAKTPFFVSYKEDVSATPKSIAVIPLLANLAPIAWFAGFDIELDELDEEFYESLNKIKIVFSKTYPQIKERGSEIKVKELIKNSQSGNNKAMLFSGGVDAYVTYFRHNEKNNPLHLITINGADIPLEDKKQWESVVHLNENEPS